MTSAVDSPSYIGYEIRYLSLFDTGRALAFPCDEHGRVPLDDLSERARSNYFYARAVIGREYEPRRCGSSLPSRADATRQVTRARAQQRVGRRAEIQRRTLVSRAARSATPGWNTWQAPVTWPVDAAVLKRSMSNMRLPDDEQRAPQHDHGLELVAVDDAPLDPRHHHRAGPGRQSAQARRSSCAAGSMRGVAAVDAAARLARRTGVEAGHLDVVLALGDATRRMRDRQAGEVEQVGALRAAVGVAVDRPADRATAACRPAGRARHRAAAQRPGRAQRDGLVPR